MTLDQLVETGARASYESLNGPWEFLSEEGAYAVRYEFGKGLAAILPMLADDLAGVAAKVILDARIGEIDNDLRSIGYILDSELRTRIAAIIEGEGK